MSNDRIYKIQSDELKEIKPYGMICVDTKEDLERLKKLIEEANRMQWVPITERPPETDEDMISDYILLSFINFDIPLVGRYKVDDDGNGYFFVGDDDKSCIERDLYVNAWMPMPEPYKEG